MVFVLMIIFNFEHQFRVDSSTPVTGPFAILRLQPSACTNLQSTDGQALRLEAGAAQIL